LTYAAARHPVPVLRGPDGAVTALPVPLGGMLGELTGPFADEVVGWPAGASAALWAGPHGRDPDPGWSDRVAAAVHEAGARVVGAEDLADVVEREVATEGGTLVVASRPPAAGPGVGQVRGIELELAEGEDPTRRARAFCYGVLSTWELPPLIREDIVLAVSELVANALLHVGAAQALRLRRTPSRVVVEVFDSERAMPRPRLADVDAESGWGLHLVRRVASRWGARAVPGGKAVWCEFEIPAAQAVVG
ncbi:MAG TPA: ATP-binding protein, partial [Cryptosporangiaceae bacterium]|nr:ATP-binding protein [Cryptosporangiaceae bacterium]